ncbi:MAG: hypothetical protein H6728_03370 [Myxococcales bacterium]|nr:hypothetical protein [Myxococcales bacterium]MCB9642090.1 hypothetical protein [Myxococcales bacterium]
MMLSLRSFRPLQRGGWLSLCWVVVFSFSLSACNDYLGGSESQKEKTEVSGENTVLPEEKNSPPEERVSSPEEKTSLPEEQVSPPEDGGTKETPPKEQSPETQPETGPAQERSCSVTIRVDTRKFPGLCDGALPDTITSVQMAGEFNSWNKNDPAYALQDGDGDGIFEGTITPPAGHHAYKFVLNDSVWCTDPNRPERKYDNDIMNSLLVVEDCTLPTVSLVRLHTPAGSKTLEADLRFERGKGGADFDPSSLEITVNGQPYSQATVRSNGTIEIRMQGADYDRYTFRVKAKDKDGKEAKQFYFYGWVEEKTFDWRDGVMYFAFVDRFNNGDPQNDATVANIASVANYQGGDLQGVLSKIEDGYFKSLGINVIWLSPLYAGPNQGELGFDGRRYSGYHGYWPTASRKIEPRFGDWDTLRRVARAAHKQGIRLLVDLASNHVHEQHAYYQNNPGWFFPKELCTDINWSKPISCWFDSFLPDIDYRKFDAAVAMTQDTVYWAQEGELDGFRVDAVKHMIHLFTRNVRAALERDVTHGQHHFYLVGETFTGAWDSGGGGIIKEYVSPEELSGQFDFPIFWEFVGLLARREGSFNFYRLDGVIKDVIDNNYYGSASIMSNFIGNHDVPRFISQAAGQISNMFSGDRGKAWDAPPSLPQAAGPFQRLRVAFTLLMALPGIPLIYYGDEIALPGETDPDNRRMMQWTGYSSEQQAVLDHLKKVANLRRQYPALRSYQRQTLFVDNERYAYMLTANKQRVIVVARRAGDASLSVSVQGIVADGQPVQDLLRQSNLSVQGGKISLQLNEDEATYLLLPDLP